MKNKKRHLKIIRLEKYFMILHTVCPPAAGLSNQRLNKQCS